MYGVILPIIIWRNALQAIRRTLEYGRLTGIVCERRSRDVPRATRLQSTIDAAMQST